MIESKPLLPVFDGHNDSLLHFCSEDRSKRRPFLIESRDGHIDLPRAQRGGMAGGLFAIFVPNPNKPKESNPVSPLKMSEGSFADAIDPVYAREFAGRIMEDLNTLVTESKGQAEIVGTIDELEKCFSSKVLAMVPHFEGAEPIDRDLKTLPALYKAGLRSIGITWSRPNAFGHGVPFKFPSSPDTGPGLTDPGKELVKMCNGLGILLDLSHISEKGFWDVARTSEAPLVATHSCVHALCPSSRNLTDKQLDAIGETDGVVGVNFALCFLRVDGKVEDAPLTEIVRHVDYMVERIGIDHVAFGSDFDGAKVPAELGDVAGLPKLVSAFREQGYDEDALAKLTHKNWLRVLRTTWRNT